MPRIQNSLRGLLFKDVALDLTIRDNLKLYQMDVAHAILFAKTIDISRVTADYSSAKFEFVTLRYSREALIK